MAQPIIKWHIIEDKMSTHCIDMNCSRFEHTKSKVKQYKTELKHIYVLLEDEAPPLEDVSPPLEDVAPPLEDGAPPLNRLCSMRRVTASVTWPSCVMIDVVARLCVVESSVIDA